MMAILSRWEREGFGCAGLLNCYIVVQTVTVTVTVTGKDEDKRPYRLGFSVGTIST